MDGLFISASGIATALQRHSVTANNIANLRTPGYRAARAEYVSGQHVGVGIGAISHDNARGPLEFTGQPLDIAADGFFRLQDANGNAVYTRDGRFGLNANGEVVTASGLQLDPPVVVPTNATSVTVGRDGTVFATVPGDAQPQVAGQIDVFSFTNPNGLESLGGNQYRATVASGEAHAIPRPNIETGFLEQSNVNLLFEQIAQILDRNLVQVNATAFRAQNEVLGELLDLTG